MLRRKEILGSAIRVISEGPRAAVLTFSDSSRSVPNCSLTFRIEPDLKEALRTAADREHRSIANMVEVLIRDYCGRNGVTIPEQSALKATRDRRPRNR